MLLCSYAFAVSDFAMPTKRKPANPKASDKPNPKKASNKPGPPKRSKKLTEKGKEQQAEKKEQEKKRKQREIKKKTEDSPAKSTRAHSRRSCDTKRISYIPGKERAEPLGRDTFTPAKAPPETPKPRAKVAALKKPPPSASQGQSSSECATPSPDYSLNAKVLAGKQARYAARMEALPREAPQIESQTQELLLPSPVSQKNDGSPVEVDIIMTDVSDGPNDESESGRSSKTDTDRKLAKRNAIKEADTDEDSDGAEETNEESDYDKKPAAKNKSDSDSDDSDDSFFNKKPAAKNKTEGTVDTLVDSDSDASNSNKKPAAKDSPVVRRFRLHEQSSPYSPGQKGVIKMLGELGDSLDDLSSVVSPIAAGIGIKDPEPEETRELDLGIKQDNQDDPIHLSSDSSDSDDSDESPRTHPHERAFDVPEPGQDTLDLIEHWFVAMRIKLKGRFQETMDRHNFVGDLLDYITRSSGFDYGDETKDDIARYRSIAIKWILQECLELVRRSKQPNQKTGDSVWLSSSMTGLRTHHATVRNGS